MILNEKFLSQKTHLNLRISMYQLFVFSETTDILTINIFTQKVGEEVSIFLS